MQTYLSFSLQFKRWLAILYVFFYVGKHVSFLLPRSLNWLYLPSWEQLILIRPVWPICQPFVTMLSVFSKAASGVLKAVKPAFTSHYVQTEFVKAVTTSAINCKCEFFINFYDNFFTKKITTVPFVTIKYSISIYEHSNFFTSFVFIFLYPF